jgi:hypothetical protein
MGFSKSASPKPTARSMARFGERATPWVMSCERRLAAMVSGGREEKRRLCSRSDGKSNADAVLL